MYFFCDLFLVLSYSYYFFFVLDGTRGLRIRDRLFIRFFFFSRGLEVVEGNFDFKVSESRLVISLFGGRISFKGLGLFIFVGNFNDSVKFRRIM